MKGLKSALVFLILTMPKSIVVGIIIKSNNALIYNYNQNQVFEAASLAKIPISLYLLEHNINLKMVLELNDADIISGTGWLQYAPVGTKLKIADLLYLILAESDNTATKCLVRYIGGPIIINQWLEANYNDTKLEINRQAVDKFYYGSTTPKEILTLFEKIIEYPLAYDYLRRNRFDWGLKRLIDRARSPLLTKFKDDLFIRANFLTNQKLASAIMSQKRAAAKYPNKEGSWQTYRHEIAMINGYMIAILTKGHNKDLPYDIHHPALQLFGLIGQLLEQQTIETQF
jgi:hypothetical protein